MDQDLDFEIGNGNSIYGGCAAMLMGEMMYFGGLNRIRQVRIVFGRPHRGSMRGKIQDTVILFSISSKLI